MKSKPLIAMTLAAMTFTMNVANAAVTFSGTLTNDIGTQISFWSSSTVAKTQDIGGDNRYGTDGYTWMNNSNNFGAPAGVLASLVQSAPSYTGGIAYTGTGEGASGSFNGADDRLLPSGTGTANQNVGYAGANHATLTLRSTTTLQQLFAYTMNRNMNVGARLA